MGKQSINVDSEGVLNTVKLHFQNEPARHKLLDVIGDLSLIGKPIRGKIVATKPGHTANIEFAKILKTQRISELPSTQTEGSQCEIQKSLEKRLHVIHQVRGS